MGTTAPKNLFGIHSILFYRLANRKPYGAPLKVLASGGVDLPAEFEDLTGGSEKFVLASEPKLITPEMKFITKDFRNFLYELFMGATVTENAAEATGNVGTVSNVKGTTVFESTDGIASILALAGSEANLKFGKLVVEATGAGTINILYSSDIDLNRGVDVDFQDDTLKVLVADVTVPPLGATVDITELGLQITGGSAAAIAFVTGDTAEFDIRPINEGNTLIDIGDSDTVFPEFGAIIYAQKRGTGEMFEIECFRCIGAGFPHNFEEKTFAQSELTVKVLKDFKRNLVMRIRHIGFVAC